MSNDNKDTSFAAQLAANQTTSLTAKLLDEETKKNAYLLVLLSTTSGSRRQLSRQERTIAMLEALEIPFETMNCALPEFRQRRDFLFQISQVQGNFPQLFRIQGESQPTFVGQWDEIETINEHSNTPPDLLSADEKQLTWDAIMGTTGKYNNKGVNLDGPNDNDDDDDSDDSEGGGGNIYADL